MVLPNHPTACPLHLIVRNMHITPEGTPCGPLLIGLVKPHGALSSDRVGALTKQILHTQGVDVTHYKPHTTRGAGKLMLLTRSPGGPGHGTLRWTRTSKQAGKALHSQGHHHARVM